MKRYHVASLAFSRDYGHWPFLLIPCDEFGRISKDEKGFYLTGIEIREKFDPITMEIDKMKEGGNGI